jgi:parallel beta-helix repeat protein
MSLCQVQPYQIAEEVKGNIILQPLAEVEYSNLQTANSVKANEPIPVKLKVQNKGKAGYANVSAIFGKMPADNKWIWLNDFEQSEVELRIPPCYQAAEHQVSVGPLQQKVLVVPVPAQFVFTDLQISSTGKAGDPIPVKVTVQNVGSEAKEEIIALTEKNKEVAAKSITLKPGEKVDVNMETTFTTSGTHEVTIGKITAAISINPIWIDQDKDGVLDTEEIFFYTFQAAIEQANAGDVIAMLPGKLYIGADQLPIQVNKPRLVIRSAFGAERTVIWVLGANQDLLKQHSLFLLKADGITIDGFTMSASVYNVCVDGVRDCIIKNNVFDFSKWYHVFLDNSSGVKVQNNSGRAALYSFLQMNNCENCLIEENHPWGDPCGFRVVNSKNNLFRNNHIDGLAWYGITLTNSEDNIIEGNFFDAIRIEGIELRQASLRNQIIGNTFYKMKNSGVLLDGESRETKVYRNNITDNRFGLTNETSYKVDAVNNWWGATDGPSDANKGSGDTVDKNVSFSPWLTKPVK